MFVGAGDAGLEGLAELQDFMAAVVELYTRSRVTGLRFILVEAFATRELRRRGIEVRTSTTVERISADSVELSDGEVIPCRTVAWTPGCARTRWSPSSACRSTTTGAPWSTATCRSRAGVVAIAAGVLLVRVVGTGAAGTGLGLALAVAACIAGYTLVDDDGVHHAAAPSCFEAVLLLTAPAYVVAVAGARGPGTLRAAVAPRPVLAGLAMFGAYAAALAALELAEAAPVAALRETSVVMAAAAAAVAARAHIPARRVAGAAIVVAGIAAIALG